MQQKDAGTRVENFFLEQADLSQPEAEKKTPIVTSQ
jgi:hypothetical protein